MITVNSENYQNSMFSLGLQQMLNLDEHLPSDASCLELKSMMHDCGFSIMI